MHRMIARPIPAPSRRDTAREARRTVEAALDRAGWPWNRRLSFWIEALVTIEEEAPSR